MTRIVEFADGLTSPTAPDISGAGTEIYDFDNNDTTVLFSIEDLTSVFIKYEIERIDDVDEYRQSGHILILGNVVQLGAYEGDDLIQSSIVDPEHVILSISGNNLQIQAGNMTGGNHVGKFKASITRFSV